MLIIRKTLAFERAFTRIPNAWIRDSRLSLKAKGLLTQLLSHQDGWQVSIELLAKQNGCGRDLIRTAVAELEEFGYLTRRQNRAQGAFDGSVWVTNDPESPSSDFPTSGFPTSGNPTPKKTNSKKTNSKNGDLEKAWEEFWSIYPRKVGKAAAKRAFFNFGNQAAVIVEGARRLASDPNLPAKQFVPYPATWLNREGWEDEPYPEDAKLSSKPSAEGPGRREWVKALHELGEHFDCLPGDCSEAPR